MKSLKFVVLGLALGSAVSMAEDCVIPAAPTIPNGEDSSLEQMLAAQKSVKEFQAANMAYMKCVEPSVLAAEAVAKEAAAKVAEKAAGAEDALKAANAELLKAQETYNAAVSMEEEVAGKFNTEIRDYKTANPDPG